MERVMKLDLEQQAQAARLAAIVTRTGDADRTIAHALLNLQREAATLEEVAASRLEEVEELTRERNALRARLGAAATIDNTPAPMAGSDVAHMPVVERTDTVVVTKAWYDSARETLATQAGLVESFRAEVDLLRAWKADEQQSIVSMAAALVSEGFKGQDGSVKSALDEVLRALRDARVRADTAMEVNRGLSEVAGENRRTIEALRAEVDSARTASAQKQRLIEAMERDGSNDEARLRRVAKVAAFEAVEALKAEGRLRA